MWSRVSVVVNRCNLMSLRRGYKTSGVICGGARPGGVPVFNWKQKRVLGLDKPREIPPFIPEGVGKFEDLLADPRYQGGELIDIPADQQDDFEYTQGKVKEADPRKKFIKVSMLYGPEKPAGPVGFEKKRQRFSHSRVFGHKADGQRVPPQTMAAIDK